MVKGIDALIVTTIREHSIAVILIEYSNDIIFIRVVERDHVTIDGEGDSVTRIVPVVVTAILQAPINGIRHPIVALIVHQLPCGNRNRVAVQGSLHPCTIPISGDEILDIDIAIVTHDDIDLTSLFLEQPGVGIRVIVKRHARSVVNLADAVRRLDDHAVGIAHLAIRPQNGSVLQAGSCHWLMCQARGSFILLLVEFCNSCGFLSLSFSNSILLHVRAWPLLRCSSSRRRDMVDSHCRLILDFPQAIIMGLGFSGREIPMT